MPRRILATEEAGSWLETIHTADAKRYRAVLTPDKLPGSERSMT